MPGSASILLICSLKVSLASALSSMSTSANERIGFELYSSCCPPYLSTLCTQKDDCSITTLSTGMQDLEGIDGRPNMRVVLHFHQS